MSGPVVRLAPNLLQHQYRGGARIAGLRGLDQVGEFQPEEWLGATNGLFHDPQRGPARTVDGELIRDLIAADPAGWLGERRGAGKAGDSGMLLKLLDAGQRLPVHAHPDRDFARTRLNSPYGKTEAWLVLAADPGAAFHLGWTEDIPAEAFAAARDRQDAAWMLERMHRVEALPGLALVVPGGTIHAIDKGIFLAEIQEPTDYSIVVEWSATSLGREESHLQLGWSAATEAISLQATPADEIDRLTTHTRLDSSRPGVSRLLSTAADPYFGIALVVAPSPPVAADFGIALALTGEGQLHFADGDVTVRAGEVFAVAHAAGPWWASGTAQILFAHPSHSTQESVHG